MWSTNKTEKRGKTMIKPTLAELKEFLSTLNGSWVSDRQVAAKLKARHLRGGKITRQDSKEGAGVAVFAFGFDELGNVCAWCADGLKRQFIG